MKKIAYSLAFLHLLIVFLSIFHFFDRVGTSAKPWLEKSVAFYSSLNYSVWSFGFFTPDVGKTNELEIKIYDTAGGEKKFSTLEGFNFFLSNQDLAKRFYGFKKYNSSDTSMQDICARSVATRMMNLFPGIYKVSYTIRSIRYPTLQGFNKKEPVSIQELYSTDFVFDGQ